MSYSLNEIEALSKRAARGAGLSWGMSEEAGKAVRWLASHGLGGRAALAELLAQNDAIALCDLAPMSLEGVWASVSGQLCPLASGAALTDCADRLLDGEALVMADVLHPVLLVPFAAWAAIQIKAPVSVSWSNLRIDTDGYGIWVNGPIDEVSATTAASVICNRAAFHCDAARLPASRGNINVSAWAELSSFAQRTYAPATEESRRLGAGAGVSDND
jgi:hypothetical protein